MACYVVFDKASNKQLRVFACELFDVKDRQRAYTLAVDMAKGLHKAGYSSIVEEMLICDFGPIVFDSDKDARLL